MTLMRMRMRVLGAAAALLAAAGCGEKSTSGLGGGPRASFKSIDITGAEYARKLELPDADGKMRSLTEFKGKVVVVFFGYTQCPDVCPTTMAELSQVRRALGPDAERLQGIFVTVDPERDTAELLASYVPAFHRSFLGLRGDAEATAKTAKEFKVFYQKSPGSSPDNYSVDHTAATFIYDPQGRLRLFAKHGSGADVLTQDVKLLIAGR